ncbi:MAG: hypothetical protein M0P39_13365 [Rhodocyclaceae bacterium]|nr:hypothetical protein [Rhodocyclaceae bacterium]
MLTKGDDYPIHQSAEPVAYSGTDRNFYDRYWFNGYNADATVFFAVAFGIYPHLGIMDGSISVVHEGVQHNIRTSRHLGWERMDTRVGPLAIEVIEPLRKLRVRLDENEYGISADIVFECLAPAMEEPRFSRRIGQRTFMDYTRMTQNGRYQGWIDVKGSRIELTHSTFRGTRDRSWGVRPIGMSDPQPPVPALPMHMFWLWAPLNFDDCFTLFHINADEKGEPWNTAAVIGQLGDNAAVEHFKNPRSELEFKPGSRHAVAARLFFPHRNGSETLIELTPKWRYFMSGVGYFHPEWGHGMNKGPLATSYDTIRLAEIQTYLPPYLHIEALVSARMTSPDGRVRQGFGVLEQLIIGPYQPYGFKELLDPAA